MNAVEQWRPTASLKAMRARAELCSKIRAFFAVRNVLEVETPLMCARGVTDPYIQVFAVEDKFLQSSPEYAMKRLLAAGYGSMFQICKVFRREESGHLHNSEFTMLEWYRVGFTHLDLIDETDALIQELLGCDPAKRISYHDLFMQFLNVNPHTDSIETLQSCAMQHGINLTAAAAKDLTVTDWLQLLMSHIIEPKLIGTTAWIVYDFPVAQAALAKVIPGECPVAARFEVYMQGIELANGYYELQNASEQEKRFITDNLVRRSQGLHEMQPDDRLVAALKEGLPDCAGIALGLDRLLMIKLQAQSIAEVLSFTTTNA
jgi:lysyl-tRNA synthetase class 2